MCSSPHRRPTRTSSLANAENTPGMLTRKPNATMKKYSGHIRSVRRGNEEPRDIHGVSRLPALQLDIGEQKCGQPIEEGDADVGNRESSSVMAQQRRNRVDGRCHGCVVHQRNRQCSEAPQPIELGKPACRCALDLLYCCCGHSHSSLNPAECESVETARFAKSRREYHTSEHTFIEVTCVAARVLSPQAPATIRRGSCKP